MSSNLMQVQAAVGDLMTEILQHFVAGSKITVIVRQPDNADADFLMTNDDLTEAKALIARRQEAG